MKPETIKVACSNCNLRELCMPMGLSEHDLERLDDLVASIFRRQTGFEEASANGIEGDEFIAIAEQGAAAFDFAARGDQIV